MKVLLLGDYSSLYNNLQDGLKEVGVDATVASHGDLWKNIPRNIDLGGGGASIFSKISRKLSPIIKLNSLSGYDVVQYINPFYFYNRWLPNRWIINNIISRNKKFFLSVAGDDAYYWKYARRNLRYHPLNDLLKYDLRKDRNFMEDENSFNFNKWLVDRADGIIPIIYEYATPTYGSHEKLKKIIPIPINIKKIFYNENVVRGKVIFFHGLNRYGFKGTFHIERAFSYLTKKYKEKAEFIIKGKMPFEDYLKLMRNVNVVVDQTSAYSLGMNGLYSMGMGKVVMGGAEPESLRSYGVKSSPVINILPSADDIIEKIECLMEEREVIQERGRQSRIFVEKHHDYVKIAKEYMKIWLGN